MLNPKEFTNIFLRQLQKTQAARSSYKKIDEGPMPVHESSRFCALIAHQLVSFRARIKNNGQIKRIERRTGGVRPMIFKLTEPKKIIVRTQVIKLYLKPDSPAR